jgi:cobalt-zinc-cadmium efflux system outer membrane protein
MSRKNSVAGAVLALACLTFPVFPDQGQRVLTLEKAVEIALARNPEVLSARAEVEASRGRSLQIGSRPEAQITAGVEGMPIPGTDKDQETEISLSFEQMIEFPGKRSTRAELGRLGIGLAEAELQRITLVVTARVKRAYWLAVFTGSAELALDTSLTRLDRLLADLQEKYRAGTAAYADVLRARAEKARLRNLRLEQENERRRARSELHRLLDWRSGEADALLDAMPFSPLSATLEDLQEHARSSSPSQKIAALRQDRAAAALKLARLNGSPDLTAALSLPSVRPGGWGLSFGLTLPFLQPRLSKGLALEASAEAEVAGLLAAARERHARSALETAYASAKIAEEQVHVFEQSLLRELTDELRIQVEYYRYGQVDFHDLLDLHRTLVMAEIDHLRAILMFNLALADLEVAGEE